jgi:hypothetical protein
MHESVADRLPRRQVGHELAVVNIQDIGFDLQHLVARLDLGLAPQGKRTARLSEMAHVAVGESSAFRDSCNPVWPPK